MVRFVAIAAVLLLGACASQTPTSPRTPEIETLRAIEYDYDILIRGGAIYDGSGGKPYVADIGVKDGLINAVYPKLKGDAAVEIDARGKAVAPGFVGAGDLAHGFTSLCASGPLAAVGGQLQNAVGSLTSVQAGRLGLKERGRIMPGWAADLVVFDEKAPTLGNTEAEDVIVNGDLAVKDHQATGHGASRAVDGCGN